MNIIAATSITTAIDASGPPHAFGYIQGYSQWRFSTYRTVFSLWAKGSQLQGVGSSLFPMFCWIDPFQVCTGTIQYGALRLSLGSRLWVCHLFLSWILGIYVLSRYWSYNSLEDERMLANWCGEGWSQQAIVPRIVLNLIACKFPVYSFVCQLLNNNSLDADEL